MPLKLFCLQIYFRVWNVQQVQLFPFVLENLFNLPVEWLSALHVVSEKAHNITPPSKRDGNKAPSNNFYSR